MKHALGLAAALVVLGCSGATPPATCTPEAREALIALYEDASGRVISSGACDAHQRVEECPAYMVLETHYLAARKGICP